MYAMRTALFCLLFLLSSSTYGTENSSFSIPPLVIDMPTGGDWQVIKKTQFGVVFKREEPDNRGYSIAKADVFRIDSSEDPAVFLAEVKETVKALLQAPNTILVDTTYTPTSERGYPCVRVRARMDVSVPASSTEEAFVFSKQMRILLCRQPGATPLGFMAAFSYTSPAAAEPFESEAEKFARNVRLQAK